MKKWEGPWDCPELDAEISRCKKGGFEMNLGYHGTDKKTAMKILEEGFKPGAYFTPMYGEAKLYGNVVLSVPFCMDFEPRGGWQWVEADRVDRCRISHVDLVQPIYENKKPFEALGKHNRALYKERGVLK